MGKVYGSSIPLPLKVCASFKILKFGWQEKLRFSCDIGFLVQLISLLPDSYILHFYSYCWHHITVQFPPVYENWLIWSYFSVLTGTTKVSKTQRSAAEWVIYGSKEIYIDIFLEKTWRNMMWIYNTWILAMSSLPNCLQQ